MNHIYMIKDQSENIKNSKNEGDDFPTEGLQNWELELRNMGLSPHSNHRIDSHF